MNFLIPFQSKPARFKINIGDSFVSIGSCFSAHIAKYLKEYKLEVLDNPFGTVYNPYSISLNIKSAISNEIDEHLFIEHQEVYYHYNFHSSIKSLSKNNLKELIKGINSDTLNSLLKADFLIITTGTAWCFKHKNTSKIVANCHKQLATEFALELMEASDIISEFEDMINAIKGINQDIKIILTVSPVRHTRFGLTENSIGKAELLKACTYLSRTYDFIHYFESYELVTDVLRDYRFFEADLIHPNAQAVEFVINEFKKIFYSSDMSAFDKSWAEIKRALAHKPFNPENEKHQEFLSRLLTKLQCFEDRIDIEAELLAIQNQIT